MEVLETITTRNEEEINGQRTCWYLDSATNKRAVCSELKIKEKNVQKERLV